MYKKRFILYVIPFKWTCIINEPFKLVERIYLITTNIKDFIQRVTAHGVFAASFSSLLFLSRRVKCHSCVFRFAPRQTVPPQVIHCVCRFRPRSNQQSMIRFSWLEIQYWKRGTWQERLSLMSAYVIRRTIEGRILVLRIRLLSPGVNCAVDWGLYFWRNSRSPCWRKMVDMNHLRISAVPSFGLFFFLWSAAVRRQVTDPTF